MNNADAVNLALLITRVAFGLMMAAHGYNKFFKGGKIAGTGRWFDSMGMRPGHVHALLAASTEVGTGLMFAAGLFTPLAAAGFIGLMTVAFWTVHKANGFFIIKEGWEYVAMIAVVAMLVATIGPGEYSLDHAFDLVDDLSGTTGFWLSLVLGLGAGHGLLAAFYRPPKKN